MKFNINPWNNLFKKGILVHSRIGFYKEKNWNSKLVDRPRHIWYFSLFWPDCSVTNEWSCWSVSPEVSQWLTDSQSERHECWWISAWVQINVGWDEAGVSLRWLCRREMGKKKNSFLLSQIYSEDLEARDRHVGEKPLSKAKTIQILCFHCCCFCYLGWCDDWECRMNTYTGAWHGRYFDLEFIWDRFSMEIWPMPSLS